MARHRTRRVRKSKAGAWSPFTKPSVNASEGTATSPADLRAEDRLLRPIGKKDVSRTMGDERDKFTVSNPMARSKTAGRKTRRSTRKSKKVSRRR